MSSPYTLSRLLEDAAARRGSAPQRDGRPAIALAEVWATIDRYVAARLEEKRGVILPNLGKIGWIQLDLGRKTVHRPFFQLADSFCRAYGLKAAGGPPPLDKDMCPMEEFNFSKAAIKYSHQLTKDHVFSGIRTLVQQIGEAVSQGKGLALEFSFGKLTSKEKDVRFAFAAALYTAHGLEVPSGAAADIEYTPSATFAPPSLDTMKGLNLKGDGMRKRSNVTATSNLLHCTSDGMPTDAPDPWEYASREGADVFAPSTGNVLGSRRNIEIADDQQISSFNIEMQSAVGSTGSRDCRKMESRVPSASARCSSHRGVVREEALHRGITDLEVRASRAMRQHAEDDARKHVAGAKEDKADRERREKMHEHSACLQRQIEAKLARRKEDALEAASQVPDCPRSFPGEIAELEGKTAPRRPTPQPRELSAEELTNKAQKLHLRQQLDEQVQSNQSRQLAIKQREQQIDARRLQLERHEIAAQHEFDRNQKAYQNDELTAAWREDRKLRDVQRNIEALEQGRRVPDPGPAMGSRGANSARTPALSTSSRIATAMANALPPPMTHLQDAWLEMELETKSCKGDNRQGSPASRAPTAAPSTAASSARSSVGSACFGAAASIALGTPRGKLSGAMSARTATPRTAGSGFCF